MATGKERGYKDWKLSKAFKRSARNYTESDTITRGAKRKSTSKWCKGIKGRKHKMAIFNKYTFASNHKCLNCGKEIWNISNRENFDFAMMRYEDIYYV